MNKNTNNYMIIIMVLLLVVAIITGAGLCYLSWSDGYSSSGNGGQTTEAPGQSDESVQADLDQAREEGRQEVLDSIKEGLEGNASAEDILNGLLKENDSEGGAAEGTDNGAQTGSDVQSSENDNAADSQSSDGTGNSTSTESSSVDNGLKANAITMADIQITADGEYQYMKDSKVASHKGIDVSKYQGTIDWKKVAADGVEYAFVRVGCRGYGSSGTLIKDETFHQNVKGALAQGIKVGAYFFSQAITVEEALEEAELVIKELGEYDITYPVAIDIERIQNDKARQDALTKEERTEICIAFLECIKEAGFIPMVYGDTETFADLLDAEQLAGYDFWICETEGQMTFPYEFAIWQYVHTGSVSGIKGDTNMSISIKEW